MAKSGPKVYLLCDCLICSMYGKVRKNLYLSEKVFCHQEVIFAKNICEGS
jgi:hypothetical protein